MRRPSSSESRPVEEWVDVPAGLSLGSTKRTVTCELGNVVFRFVTRPVHLRTPILYHKRPSKQGSEPFGRESEVMRAVVRM